MNHNSTYNSLTKIKSLNDLILKITEFAEINIKIEISGYHLGATIYNMRVNKDDSGVLAYFNNDMVIAYNHDEVLFYDNNYMANIVIPISHIRKSRIISYTFTPYKTDLLNKTNKTKPLVFHDFKSILTHISKYGDVNLLLGLSFRNTRNRVLNYKHLIPFKDIQTIYNKHMFFVAQNQRIIYETVDRKPMHIRPHSLLSHKLLSIKINDDVFEKALN